MNERGCARCPELEARIEQLYAECRRLETQADGYKEQYHDLYRRDETERYLAALREREGST